MYSPGDRDGMRSDLWVQSNTFHVALVEVEEILGSVGGKFCNARSFAGFAMHDSLYFAAQEHEGK